MRHWVDPRVRSTGALFSRTRLCSSRADLVGAGWSARWVQCLIVRSSPPIAATAGRPCSRCGEFGVVVQRPHEGGVLVPAQQVAQEVATLSLGEPHNGEAEIDDVDALTHRFRHGGRWPRPWLRRRAGESPKEVAPTQPPGLGDQGVGQQAPVDDDSEAQLARGVAVCHRLGRLHPVTLARRTRLGGSRRRCRGGARL